MGTLEPPPGWTVVREQRQVATEDAASAFTDGHQWTVRDPTGRRPPQAEWPTAWRRQAVLYAHMMAAHAAGRDEAPPPYRPSPTAMDLLPREHRAVDPVYRPRDYQVAKLAETARKANPDRDADAPDRVLVHRTIAELAELVALCSPAKLALGVTKEFPAGQLGPGWTWTAMHGFGLRGADGRIAESVMVRLTRGQRGAVFIWSRPVPDPRLMIALGLFLRPLREGAFWLSGRTRTYWPTVAAVLAVLPAPGWKSWWTSAWTIGATGRPEDTPRAVGSADVKKEIRS